MRFFLTLACLTLVPFAAAAQPKKEVGPIKVIQLDRKDPISYEKDVEPIFYKRCTVCHSGNLKEGKFDIATYEGLVKGGKRGSSIKPGKADDSLLYKVMARTQKPFMPPRGEEPCTPEELAIIKLWIDQGAKAPTGTRPRKEILVGTPPANVKPVRALAVSPDKTTVAATLSGLAAHRVVFGINTMLVLVMVRHTEQALVVGLGTAGGDGTG